MSADLETLVAELARKVETLFAETSSDRILRERRNGEAKRQAEAKPIDPTRDLRVRLAGIDHNLRNGEQRRDALEAVRIDFSKRLADATERLSNVGGYDRRELADHIERWRDVLRVIDTGDWATNVGIDIELEAVLKNAGVATYRAIPNGRQKLDGLARTIRTIEALRSEREAVASELEAAEAREAAAHVAAT